MPTRRPDFTPMLVGFSTELRRAGLTVGSGEVLTYCAAATVVDVTDMVDLYWAGRCTLVSRQAWRSIGRPRLGLLAYVRVM